jgi:PAS domain S-box-containing protein
MKPGDNFLVIRLRHYLHRFYNLNLQQKITFSLVLGSLFIGATIALPAFLLSRMQLLENANTAIAAIEQLERQRIQLLLVSDLSIAESLAANSVTANALADSIGRETYLVPLLLNQKLQTPGASLTLTDYMGRTAAASQPKAISFQASPAFAAVMQTSRPIVMVERNPDTAGATLLVILPVIYRLSGNVEGAIVLSVPLSSLLPKATREVASYITDASGQVLSGTPPDGVLLQARGDLKLPAPMNTLGLVHHQVQNPSAVLRNLNIMAAVFFLLGIVLILLVVFAAHRAGLWLATPLHELVVTSETIALTGKPQSLPSRSGGDEFARVSLAFNQMVARLQQLHAELEQSVEERTLALSSSERRLQYVMDATGEGVWDWDVSSGYASHNTQWCTLLGLDNSFLKHSIEVFKRMLHPDDLASAMAAIQLSFDQGVPYNHEHRMLRADGRVIWVLDRGKVVEVDQDGRPTRMVGSIMDITDRILATEQVRVRELYLRATLDNLPFLFWLKDAESHFLSVNSVFAKACGHDDPTELTGLNDLDIWPEELARLYRADDQSVMASRREKSVEEPVETHGELRWIETYKKPVIADDGSLLGTVGFARDVTDRRMAETTLRDRTEQLDAIFSLSPDGFVTFDTDRKIKFVNPAFQAMTGFNANELNGLDEAYFTELLAEHCNPAMSFTPPDTLPANLGEMSSEKSRRRLIELITPKRRVLEVGLRASQSGTVSQILYFRDVTYEAEVDHMKSEFMSTAAHELRTPMASILGFSELLMSRDFDEATRKELLETIHKQSELLVSILNELLDLARIEARRGKDFVLQPLSLSDLLQEANLVFSPPADRDSPKLMANNARISIQADRKKLLQVIANVLSNAYKYSPQGGEVVIRLLPRSLRDGQLMSGFSIEDNGIGMSPEQLARICERFYRADTSGKIPGTGLGMSIVKEIVELHRGTVNITSQVGNGTTVTVWLPVSNV